MLITASAYLEGLIEQGDAAAARLAAVGEERLRPIVAAARRDSARLSARLDASPLTEATAERVDAGWRPDIGPAPSDEAAGGWAAALKLETAPAQDVAAFEYANLLACFDAEPQAAATIFAQPLETLARLHRVICQGLVADDIAGRLRRTPQAVHDGAQGAVLFNAPEPEALPELMDELASWLQREGPALPAVLVAGVVHGRLLEYQPFEAANGRLARSAARTVLRARGIDFRGAGVAERMLAADPLGYHREVAATIRRRGELGPWLERCSEAVVAGLEQAARVADLAGPTPPARAARIWRGFAADSEVTLAEYAAEAGTSIDVARGDLAALVAAGLAERQPGARGLRFRAPSD